MTPMSDSSIKCPFPWFGGKSQAAPLIWTLLGDVDHFVDPFCGSMSVLLNRPHPCNRPYFSETVNDADCLLENFWRSVQWHPEATAAAASWPVSECSKQARGIALLRWRDEQPIADLMAGSPEWCDPVMAGWWAYVVCCTIGAFAGDGAWTVDRATGRIIKQALNPRPENGVKRNLPHLGDNGQGVNKPQIREPGVVRDLPHLGDDGRGVNHAGTREPGVVRDLPHLGNDGQGVNKPQIREPGVLRLDAIAADPSIADIGDWGAEFHDLTMPKLIAWFKLLSARLRHVRILCGDWKRAITTGASHTLPVRQGGVCGYLMDPPYGTAAGRDMGLYLHESGDVAAEVRAWCLANGDNPRNRIVLCGFSGEGHEELLAAGWTEHEWFKAGFLRGGMGNTGAKYSGDGLDGDKHEAAHQQARERIWASPHCLSAAAAPDPQGSLFEEPAATQGR